MIMFQLRNANGTIATLHETGGTVTLDSGDVLPFDRGDCYRDGTSFGCMRVGDRCRLDREEIHIAGRPHRGISSPNIGGR